MASGRFNLKGDSCCDGYVIWSSTWISGNSHSFSFQLYGVRTDWSGSTTFWSNVTKDGSWLCGPNANIKDEGLICSETTTVTSNDAGKMTTSLVFDIGFTSSGTGESFSASKSATGLQLDKPAKSLRIVRPTGTSVTVKSSSGAVLSNNATVYYGDIITITTGTVTGYTETSVSVSGATAGSDGQYTVTGNVTITASASVQSFTLNISAGVNSSIAVTKIASPLKQEGVNSTWTGGSATVYYNDQLQIIFAAASAEYKVDTHTVNGNTFTSGGTHTVTSNVNVVSTAAKQGLAYLGNGSSFDPYLIYIGNGSSWDLYIPYVGNGSGWEVVS